MTDVSDLDSAIRAFFLSFKRPGYWSQLSTLAGVSLDRPAAGILQYLSVNGDCHVQDLAKRLGVETPSITRLSQALANRGYVKRLPDEQDRRAVILSLTPTGRKTAQALRQAQQQLIDKAISHWSATDKQRLTELFERFSQDFIEASSYGLNEVK